MRDDGCVVVNQVGPEAVAPLCVGVEACGMWHVGRGRSGRTAVSGMGCRCFQRAHDGRRLVAWSFQNLQNSQAFWSSFGWGVVCRNFEYSAGPFFIAFAAFL